MYRYKFVANGNTFVIVCNHIIVCDKRIYMYSVLVHNYIAMKILHCKRTHLFVLDVLSK